MLSQCPIDQGIEYIIEAKVDNVIHITLAMYINVPKDTQLATYSTYVNSFVKLIIVQLPYLSSFRYYCNPFEEITWGVVPAT